MIASLIADALMREGPLKISRVNYSNYIVTLGGDSWGIAISCKWRLLRGAKKILDSEEIEAAAGTESELCVAENELAQLVGHSITGARTSRWNLNDPILSITGGYLLEIESDIDLDPWVLRFPKEVFVGRMP